MSENEEQEVPGLRWPLGMVFLAPLLTAMAYLHASLPEARRGAHHSKGKKIAVFSGDLLGQTGSLAGGGLVTAGALVWLFVTIKKRRRIGSASESDDR